jgi:hypothetical protein
MKPLLTLFIFIAHLAVWGQDTIKFEQINPIDTVYSFEELSKRGHLEYNFFKKGGVVDSLILTIENRDDGCLAKKINNKWILYDWHNWNLRPNSWYKVDERFYIKNDGWANSGVGSEDSCGLWRWSWEYESFLILDILEMRMSLEEMFIKFDRSGGYMYDELEGDDYKQKLKSCKNTYESFNADFKLKNNRLTVSVECSGGDYVIDPETNEHITTTHNNSHCFEEGYLQAGEYHYINGNFVKVK